MARFCIAVLIMLLSMCAFSAVARSPSTASFWLGRKSSAAAVSFWHGEQSPAGSAETPTTPSPPSLTPSSESSPTSTISPSVISFPPADAPGQSINGAVLNGIAFTGSLLVALVAAVLLV